MQSRPTTDAEAAAAYDANIESLKHAKNYWEEVIKVDKAPKTCQIYGLIRHPISKLASSIAQEWTAHKD